MPKFLSLSPYLVVYEHFFLGYCWKAAYDVFSFLPHPSGRQQEFVKKTALDGHHLHSQPTMQGLELDPGYNPPESRSLPCPTLLSLLGQSPKKLQWILVKCITIRLILNSSQCHHSKI